MGRFWQYDARADMALSRVRRLGRYEGQKGMAGRGEGPDFVESLARGLDVLQCFSAGRPRMSLSEVAAVSGLARPTARRLLLTLEELGFVRLAEGQFSLTPRVLSLGMAFVASLGLWEVGRPHLERLVAQTGESSSMSQLDGSDIVYVARVAVPKLITLRVEIGTRFPAAYTSQGKVLLAALGPGELARVLAQPSRSGLPRFLPRDPQAFGEELCTIRARGWALADEELAPGIRSIAAPVRDGTSAVRAAMNVTVHAAETSVERLTGDSLPLLLRTAGDVSADWALWQSRPYSEVRSGQGVSSTGGRSSG
jgi:IclR family pca regulon transcriptional regulator